MTSVIDEIKVLEEQLAAIPPDTRTNDDILAGRFKQEAQARSAQIETLCRALTQDYLETPQKYSPPEAIEALALIHITQPTDFRFYDPAQPGLSFFQHLVRNYVTSSEDASQERCTDLFARLGSLKDATGHRILDPEQITPVGRFERGEEELMQIIRDVFFMGNVRDDTKCLAKEPGISNRRLYQYGNTVADAVQTSGQAWMNTKQQLGDIIFIQKLLKSRESELVIKVGEGFGVNELVDLSTITPD